MYSLLKSLKHFQSKQDYVLAIIVESNGSTYRKPGAMMLIDQNQKYWGLLSGGCLEGDIVMQSQKVLASQRDEKIIYNMRDAADLLWGMGLGCDGEVSILLKHLPAAQQHWGFFTALDQCQQGHSQSLTITADANHSLNIQPLSEKSSEPFDGYTFELTKPYHLLICGGSPDVPPVVAIAHQIGWKTTVIDHRADSAISQRFPLADNVEHIKRSQWSEFNLSGFDGAVIMSHQFEHDQRYLQRLLESDLSYIGLLGPTKRRNKLLANCGSQFNFHEGRVFGPVGLDIGADTPETIALAIIAEIQAVRNNKKVIGCYQDPTR